MLISIKNNNKITLYSRRVVQTVIMSSQVGKKRSHQPPTCNSELEVSCTSGTFPEMSTKWCQNHYCCQVQGN